VETERRKKGSNSQLNGSASEGGPNAEVFKMRVIIDELNTKLGLKTPHIDKVMKENKQLEGRTEFLHNKVNQL
jgi:hypothetical protein